MRVSGYSWAGVRTEDFQETISFFVEAMGLPLSRRDDVSGYAVFRLPSGQDFEVFGPHSEWYQLHSCPVLGFEVDDVGAARQELETRGVEFVTQITEGVRTAWTYFRGPDGYLYELTGRWRRRIEG